MEKSDLLKIGDKVTVTILDPDNNVLYTGSDTVFHQIEQAITDTFKKSGLTIDPKDCVFEVSNDETGVSHRYRLNAHGNAKLIV